MTQGASPKGHLATTSVRGPSGPVVNCHAVMPPVATSEVR
ncbi:hypothetical protein PA08_0692 [Cutibacterium modestum P08]|nr:hypothetical protein PA08_0692 [Cutibacterium modestum P08]